MKKSVFVLIVIIICFTSCRHQEIYEFLNTKDRIFEISIVTVSFDENQELVQTELKKIDNVETFLADFEQVDCYTYYGDPTGITEVGVQADVIKILYEDGEYELVNWNGQADYTQNRGFRYYAGFSVFDEEQFNALITKYSAN